MSTINEALMDLFMNKYGDADAIFVVHGTEVKAHKFFISTRSDTLRAMLNFGEQPVDGRYTIDDPKVTPEVFKEFLKFLYVDACDIDFDNLGALIHMSQMYFVPQLKEFCTAFVKTECSSVAGIIQTGEIAILYEKECPDLLRCCFEGLGKAELQSFTCTTNQKTTFASRDLVERIVKNCPRTVTLTEDAVLQTLFKWTKLVCEHEKNAETYNSTMPDCVRRKNCIYRYIKMLNLDNVSDKVFIDIIHRNGLLARDEYFWMLVKRLEKRVEESDAREAVDEDIIYL